MKIKFENLGCIEQGSVELNDFTIFCGKNNSGKTYAMYALYGLLANRFTVSFDFVKPIVERLKQEGSFELDIVEIINQYQEEMLKHIEQCFNRYLPNLFGVSENDFNDSVIKLFFLDSEIKNQVEINDHRFYYFGKNVNNSKDFVLKKNNGKIILTLNYLQVDSDFLQTYISWKLIDIIFFDIFVYNNIFLLPAERNGINIFSKELFSIRNLLLQQTQNNNVNPMFLLKDVFNARYAEPIKGYLQFINNISSIQEENSIYIGFAQVIQNNVLGGDYLIDELGNVSFTIHQNNKTIPLHFTSSTIKSLFGLVFYLKHLAKPGDCLMIDEPELNLHPDNQRQVARLLAQLVNAGLKVIVSTHSDYFVRELNNLIMLKKDFTGVKELQEKYGYQDNELLDGEKQVSAYLFDDKKVTPIILNEDEGIIAKTFDDVINKLNEASDDIYYTMKSDLIDE